MSENLEEKVPVEPQGAGQEPEAPANAQGRKSGRPIAVIAGCVVAVALACGAAFAMGGLPGQQADSGQGQGPGAQQAAQQGQAESSGANGAAGTQSGAPQAGEAYAWVVSKCTVTYGDDPESVNAYHYDDEGRLSSIETAEDGEQTQEVVFSYTEDGLVSGAVTRFPEEEGDFNPLAYEYDSSGKCTRYWSVDNYSDGGGYVVTYEYDGKGRVSRSHLAEGTEDVVEGEGVELTSDTTYSYTDEEGLNGTLHEVGDYAEEAGDPLDNTYKFKDGIVEFGDVQAKAEYDEHGNLVKQSYKGEGDDTITYTYEYQQVKVDAGTYVPNIFSSPTARVDEGSYYFPPVLNAAEAKRVVQAEKVG